MDAVALQRILIVDDSRMVRATIGKHIRGSFEVREEADGEAAWETLLADDAIQVLISDLSMPKLDGFGLLARLRESDIGRLRELPVIVISGEEDEASRLRAQEAGANDFITKGIGTAELLARVTTLAKLARTHQDLAHSREEAAVDPLGLMSRAVLMRQAEQILAWGERRNIDVGALVVGFDKFDELIAAHGRQLGDMLLSRFARMLANAIRKEDSIARFDTAQFAIVSPDTQAAASAAFAQRLSTAVAAAKLNYQGQELRISVSIGVANSRSDGMNNADALLTLAQQRLGQARKAGGNRVIGAAVAANPAPPPPSVDAALAALAGARGEPAHALLAPLGLRLLPLLQLLDREYGLGLPLAEYERRIRGQMTEDR